MKKIVKVLLLFFFFITFINAQETNNAYIDGSSRNNLENYGVNKQIVITDNNKPNILRTPKVDASKKIYDYSNILSEEEENKIKEYIDDYIEQTNMDMVFVTINMPYTNDIDNENYAADFYDYNDFGINYTHYSGLILLRNTYEADPYYGAYFFGEAQLYYDQFRMDHMLDEIYDYFHSNNYVEGFNIFYKYALSYYNNGKSSDNYEIGEDGSIIKIKGKFQLPIFGGIISGSIVTLIGLLIMVKKNKMIKKASKANDYFDKNSVNFNDRTDQFLTTFTTRTRISSDSSSGGMHSSFGSSGRGHTGGGRHG